MLAESSASEQRDALLTVLLELERHVGGAGWDAPPRLFALVLTDLLVSEEPALAADLGLRTTAEGAPPSALTAIEQEDFVAGEDLIGALAELGWPDTVAGCALSAERTFLPAGLEAELPPDPVAAAAYVAGHPGRQEVRVVVGALRGSSAVPGVQHGVARLRSHPAELLAADRMVPALGEALAHTLAAAGTGDGPAGERHGEQS